MPATDDEVCPCPAMPVNYWHHPVTGWSTGSVIDGTAQPGSDARRFNAGGYDAWAVRCPDCGRVYASMTSLTDG